MIRYINCVRRRQDISVEEFRRYWNSPEFEALFRRVCEIVQPLRFAKNLTLQVAANAKIQDERGLGDPFDATVEMWWQNAGELLDKFESPEALDIRQEMLDYQEQFIDIQGCRAFFSDYETREAGS
jgi:hypothetical protein